MRTIVVFGMLIGSLGVVVGAPPRDLVALESKCLGEGVFEYTLSWLEDRYFEKCEFQTFSFGFENVAEWLDTPANWSLVGGEWRHDKPLLEDVPYQCTFRVRSDQTTHKLSAATIALGFNWRSWARPPEMGSHAVGFVNLLCLVPCPPAEADGSERVYVARMPGYPEPEVESLLTDKGQVVGLRFTAGNQLPVVIEASDDLREWRSVGSSTGSGQVVTWMSAAPSEASSRFYRIVIRGESASEP